jgi:hypothetical protein
MDRLRRISVGVGVSSAVGPVPKQNNGDEHRSAISNHVSGFFRFGSWDLPVGAPTVRTGDRRVIRLFRNPFMSTPLTDPAGDGPCPFRPVGPHILGLFHAQCIPTIWGSNDL